MAEVQRAVMTTAAKKIILEAHAGVRTEVKPIKYIAVGNGGLDGTGALRKPTGNEQQLYNELYRMEIDKAPEQISSTCYRYAMTIPTGVLNGEAISEIGVFDADGIMLSIRTMGAKTKEADIEMIIEVDDKF